MDLKLQFTHLVNAIGAVTVQDVEIGSRMRNGPPWKITIDNEDRNTASFTFSHGYGASVFRVDIDEHNRMRFSRLGSYRTNLGADLVYARETLCVHKKTGAISWERDDKWYPKDAEFGPLTVDVSEGVHTVEELPEPHSYNRDMLAD